MKECYIVHHVFSKICRETDEPDIDLAHVSILDLDL